MLLSFWSKMLLLILRMLARRTFFSTYRLQVQSGLIVSRNECLNLWSQRWLKFTRSTVRYFIPLALQHCGTIWSRSDKLKDAFLKGIKLLVEFRIAGSSWFHSLKVDGKKIFLKKLCLIFIKGTSTVFLLLWLVFLAGTTLHS